jgi:HlyD family secretion protein
MDRSIFRSAAVERLSSPERLDQPVRITTTLGWSALIALLLLVTAGCVASVAILAPEKVPGDGVIISPVGILEVPFPSSGRLAEIQASIGEPVTKGSIVARIEQPELRRSLEEAHKAYDDLKAERQHVADFQQQARLAQEAADTRRRHDLEQSIGLVEQRLGFLHEREVIDTELGAKHLITRAQAVDTKVATGTAQEELAATGRQINDISLNASRSRIQDMRELLALDLKVDAAQRQIALIAERLKQAEQVVSPYDGTVVEYKHDVGELVQQGAALVTLLPSGLEPTTGANSSSDPLQVVLFVPNTEGKKITPNMTAEITPSTVRREEYGFVFARVKRVAAIPATAEGMLHVLKNQQLVNALSAGGAPFEVDVELLRDPNAPSGYLWSSAPGPVTTISPGTLTHGTVWIRRLRLIEFAIPALRRLFGHTA